MRWQVTESSQEKSQMAVDQIMGTHQLRAVDTFPPTYDDVQLVVMVQQIFPVGMD